MHPDPELLALLALGEDVGDADRDHVATCPTCTHEVAELSQLVGIGRTSGTAPHLQAPPQRVWDATVAELGLTTRGPGSDAAPADVASVVPPRDDEHLTAGPTGTTNDAGGHPPRRARHAADGEPTPGRDADSEPRQDAPRRGLGRRAVSLVLAAALALVVGFGLGHLDGLPSRPETIASTQLAALPSWPDSSGDAQVVRDRDGHRWLVITMHTPQPVDGSREVWLINTTVSSMFSLGYLSGTGARLLIPDGLDLSAYPIVDVSREPFGDTDPAHSRNSIVRGTLAQ